jgi:hypothetical protein
VRLLHLYLIAYFVLVIGAGLALWQAGVVARLPGAWLALAALITIGLGVVLALTSSSRPPLVRD